jgi:hypothetical protein
MPAKYDITAYQGDTFTLTFTLEGDFTSQTPAMQVRVTPATGSTTLASPATITIVDTYDAPTNLTTVVSTISATNMATLSATTVYAYDFQYTNGSVVTTYLYGSFAVTAEVTR